MLVLLFSIGISQASPSVPIAAKQKWQLSVEKGPSSDENGVSTARLLEPHGPEKPPPDDGYTFKGADGGNWLGKIGLACSLTGIALGGYALSQPPAERSKVAGSGAGLFAGGVLMLWLERRS